MRLEGGVRLAKTYKKEAGRSAGPEATFSTVFWGFCG